MSVEDTELTEDEQFAEATKGSPYFDGKPEDLEPANTGDDADDDAGDGEEEGASAQEADAQGHGEQAADEGAGEGDDPDIDDAGGDQADASQGADGGQGADEPFPGYGQLGDEARKHFDKINNDYRALHGMTAPLQRGNAELRRQMEAQQARIQQLEQMDRTSRKASEARDEAIEGFDEWAKQFPEESKAVLSVVNPLRDKVSALEGSLSTARAELGSLHQERQQAALAREIGELERIHGDWRQIHDSPDYWEWLNQQTPGIQHLNQSMFAGDTVQLLNLYKSNRQPAAAPAPAPATDDPSGADAVKRRRTQALNRGTHPHVRSTESPTRKGASQDGAMGDEDAQFAALVGDSPLFR